MSFSKSALAGLALGAAVVFATPASAQAPGEDSAVPDTSCLYDCLISMVKLQVEAVAARDPSRLPVAANVVFTENNVVLPLGEGLWATADDIDQNGLAVADEVTGNAAWFGSVGENGNRAFYAVRIHVEDGLIDEIESVVHRRTGLPAPFGNWEGMEHFPEFYQELPESERRPRERLKAIGDAYFDTVELNDGQVLAPFSEDCARLENGILTTAVREGEQQSAAATASGCKAQFELGIYRINKRIRRHINIIDEKRGVVVASGFFDHANEFDRYKLTDGREMRTALKWPNSITLIEAFRIRNAEIQRIEATFTYVPYFMHNVFWGPEAPMPRFAPDPAACDDACLAANARSVANAMVDNQWQDVNWGETVGYSENSVGIRVGESIWRTVTAVDPAPLVIADSRTGKAVWIGRIDEHGQPARAAFVVAADGNAVGSVDATIRRKEYGAPWAEPDSATSTYPVLPASSRTPRETMLDAGTAFFDGIVANREAPAIFASSCRWLVNGQDLTECGAPFGSPMFATLSDIRERELLAVDEERGLAVWRTFEDFPAENGQGYPRTNQVVEMLHFTNGKVDRIEAIASELPYGMRPR